jgi:hypothetical protein
LARILAGYRGKDIRLLTRFDLNGFYAGVSDLSALRMVIERGGTVAGVKRLHSKLFLFGERAAIAGSANLTEAAMHSNHEFGFVSQTPHIINQCQRYFDDLWNSVENTCTSDDLARWQFELDRARERSGEPTPTLPDYGSDAVVDSPLLFAGPALPDDRRYFVKFFGSGSERSLGSRSIEEDVVEGKRYERCTYGRPPRRVQDGDVIFMARVMRAPNDYRIFGQALALAHRPGIDVIEPLEIHQTPRLANWPHYIRVYEPRFLDGTLGDGVSLNALMQHFDWRSFASTFRNRRRGKGNTNPRRSLSQQPQVELTPQSAAWLQRQLDEAFARKGRLDLSAARQ